MKKHKVTDGNQMKMREVLDDIVGIAKIALNVNSVGNCNDSEMWRIIDKCKSVLSEPPRNCDVGTAEEQWVRFKKHCEENSQAEDPDYCSSRCDVDGGCVSQCALKWAQMPYEQEGDGDGK